MAKLVRKQPTTRFPDLFDWMETQWAAMLPFASGHPVRIEEYTKDDRHVVRAELPGLDPDKDIEVTIDSGVLTIHAERHEEHEESHRSEFRYGSLTRSVTLPAGADPDNVTATYEKGVLEVRIPVSEAKTQGHRIAIKQPE
ncbi:MAG: Hsp20/alpha crystallin family protein [Streptosporangiaceae bacterium]|jgi:HSP20 family protein